MNMAPPTVRESGDSSRHRHHQRASSSSHRSGRPARGRGGDEQKGGELICRVKYNNNLPDIPFDPKFITYPFDPSRFVQYQATSLEKNYKFDILTEADLGVKIDLINPDTYAVPNEAESGGGFQLDPADEKLLEEEERFSTETKRAQQHSRVVPWLRKTEYISNEFTRYGTSNERNETKVGFNVRRKLNHDTFYKDRESQIDAIQKSFDTVKTPSTSHYSKPGVYAVQELPIFPDFDLWKIACAQVMFDSDPVPKSSASTSDPQREVTQALIRGMMDESGEQFVAYFLPTEDTLEKRRLDAEKELEYDPEIVYDYKLAREYNWNVKNKASKGYEENYFLVFRQEGVFYNELETRVRLNKRRHLEGKSHVNNSRLVVTHRSLNDQEEAAQEMRLLQLQPEAELLEDEVQELAEEAAADAEKEKAAEEESGDDDAGSAAADKDKEDEKENDAATESEEEEEDEDKATTVETKKKQAVDSDSEESEKEAEEEEVEKEDKEKTKSDAEEELEGEGDEEEEEMTDEENDDSDEAEEEGAPIEGPPRRSGRKRTLREPSDDDEPLPADDAAEKPGEGEPSAKRPKGASKAVISDDDDDSDSD